MPQSERIEQLTRESVIALNKIWADEGWTNLAIVEEMRRHGEQTSESTVQKMRKKGAEDNRYNYNLTIKPMLRVFARISNEPVSVSEAQSAEEVQVATLNNTILMREADIAVLKAELKAAQDKIEDDKVKIGFLRSQNEEKDKQLQNRAYAMQERWKIIEALNGEKKQLTRELLFHRLAIIGFFILAIIGFATDKILF